MPLPKHYTPQEAELRWMRKWEEAGVYHFSGDGRRPVYSIDTPPATVSGRLHLGHVYSYSHPDFIARYRRMRGEDVFYPMGYDDNGLPTERLVEKRLGITAQQMGRTAFIEKCLQASQEAEQEYEALWKRLGLSIDWRHTYRTIDENSRRTSQASFLDLARRGIAYRKEAPAIWCPECRTSIAQAEVNDLEQDSEFVILPFYLLGEADGGTQNLPLSPHGGKEDAELSFLPIATTRPELLPACVAVFVHPSDARYRGLVGRQARVPFFGQAVPVLADPGADPEKGTGVVMCCTFGDTADVAWWNTHRLPLIQAIDREGKLTPVAGPLAGMSIETAHKEMKRLLQVNGLLLGREPVRHSLRVHERCDTPVEYLVLRQWFIRVLDAKEALLEAGEGVRWHPETMKARYRAWVQNLNWDWCISRQRYYGVPFPVWYCQACGETILAEEAQLPVDPLEAAPGRPCACGSTEFLPEADILDTWATSSMSPQIVGKWLEANSSLYERVFPFSLRPQGHEIIRTWAFYTIVKSLFHFGVRPWSDALISGWGLAGEGMGKISKSRGGGPMPPLEMIQSYSADAVRYWAASTSPGKDAVISEEKIRLGARLVTKLWNVARFAERFLSGDQPAGEDPGSLLASLSPADRWILSRLQRVIRRVTDLLEGYDYAAAKSELETFFWREVTDNYLEMSKQRLYDPAGPGHEAARFTLAALLWTLLKLFAPFLPFVTEEIYQGIWAGAAFQSIHTTRWPEPDPRLEDESAEATGQALVQIATAVRRYKSEQNLPLGFELDRLQLSADDLALAGRLKLACADLMSITRARQIDFPLQVPGGDGVIELDGRLKLKIIREVEK